MLREIRSMLKEKFGKVKIKDLIAVYYTCNVMGITSDQIIRIVRLKSGYPGIIVPYNALIEMDED